MSESLPSLRYHVNASHTEGADLGGGNSNTWTNENGGNAQERAFIKYNFTASSGYTQRQEDWSTEGQAIYFDYDLSKSPYAKKRQFVLGTYAYVISKDFQFNGNLSSGSTDCYLTTCNGPGRKQFKRNLSTETLAIGDSWFSNISEGAYLSINRQYLYPQPGLTKSGFLQDQGYTASAEIVFSGVNGTYPPYLDVVAEDVVPSVTGAQPVDCFADKTEDITLSWQMTYEGLRYADFEGYESDYANAGNVYGSLSQKAARVRWKENGGAVHEILIDGGASSCVLPANSVSGEGFQWQVELCTDDDVWSVADSWYSVSCDNDTVSTAVALQPQKRTIDGGSDNIFTWEHHSESGSRPTGADLQYSVDGSSWEELIHIDSRDCAAVVPANSLPAGLIYWRVRTYNASSAAGLWSDAVQVTVRNAPPTPQILSVSSTPFPEVHWTAEGQMLAELRLDQEVQRIYGNTLSYRWKSLVQEGSHSMAVRVQNVYGLWSPWAETMVTVVNYPQSGLVLEGEVEGETVRLTWNRSYYMSLVYRDGQLLASLTNSELSYEDEGLQGTHSYLVRGVGAEGYYSDSNELPLTVILRGAVLCAEADKERKVALSGRYGEPVLHRCTVEQELHLRRFAGQELPLAFGTKHWKRVHSFSFSLEKEQLGELELLSQLSGERVLYRDDRGVNVSGVLGQVLSLHRGLYIDVEFTITETARG